ncbi:MAG: histidine kinase [Acetobacter sp.]|nr:histidine kinase [Acetobacter sp.]
MSSKEIIDPVVIDETDRERTWVHFVLPLFLTVVALGVIAWVGITSYKATNNGALKLTRDLMDASQRYIGQEVGGYIMPASAGDMVASSMLAYTPPQLRDKIFYSYSTTMLQKVPQLQSFYLANDQGDFILITRAQQKGVFDHIKLVTKGKQRFFRHTLYNIRGIKIKEYEQSAGQYDPRERSWYKDTANVKGIKWAKPFLFPADRQLVMTSSIRFHSDDGHTFVYAANISLNELSDYLGDIKIGHDGNAMIVDNDGRMIAARDMLIVPHLFSSRWAAGRRLTSESRVLGPTNHPIFALGYDHYRVMGPGAAYITRKGKSYIVLSSKLKYSTGWVLLIVVPEKDFSSFATQSRRQSLKFVGIIIVFSGLLGGLFIRQLRRAERGLRIITEQRSQMIRESTAVWKVAVAPDLFNPTAEPTVLTEQLVQVTQARRASLWRFLHDGAGIICEDSYDGMQNTHTGGFQIGRSQLEPFFLAVEEGNIIEVPSADLDERTKAFDRLVMREIGTHALSMYPITGSLQRVQGVLILEDATIAPYQQYFMALVSAISGIRFSAQTQNESRLSSREDAKEKDNKIEKSILSPLQFNNLLMQDPALDSMRGVGVYDAVAVLVVTFSDPVIMNVRDVESLLTLISRLAIDVKTVAEEKQLFAVELAGHRMICMAGCTTQSDSNALVCIADAALKMREAFIRTLADADLEPVFSMGIDYGPAFGGMLGEEGHVFNLWGQTVSLAELMAESASDPGVIQVTERVYAVLREQYLLRSRGTFFASNLGVGRAYTLVARR